MTFGGLVVTGDREALSLPLEFSSLPGGSPFAMSLWMLQVLVVDDSPLVRALLEESLCSTFEVVQAADGAEAVRLAQIKPMDAVLCDLSMPGLSGLEVVKLLKAMHPLVPIIMFTESIELQDAVEAMRLGAFGYLPKGVADQILLDEIHKALAHRGVLERNRQLEADAEQYQRERERNQVIEQETRRHTVELEGLVEEKTRQISQLEAARAHEAQLASMGSLVAGIAHEVNNPLAVIKSGARFLSSAVPALEGSDREEVVAVVEEIEECATRIQRIVEGLKKMSGHVRADSTCRPEFALTQALSQCRKRIAEGVTVDFNVDPEATQVGLSQDDLVLVFSQLLSNASDAIKGRGEKGTVKVRVRTEGGNVTMEVKDDGCGIAPEHLNQVCNPFFTTKPPGAGTGLGLSLVQQVIKNALGSLQIDSVVGSGTRIEFKLPADARQRQLSPAARS